MSHDHIPLQPRDLHLRRLRDCAAGEGEIVDRDIRLSLGEDEARTAEQPQDPAREALRSKVARGRAVAAISAAIRWYKSTKT